MSLSSCVKCWDNPCTCGWDYRNMSFDQLHNQIDTLTAIMNFKIEREREFDPPIFSSFGQPDTEDDKIIMVYVEAYREQMKRIFKKPVGMP